MSNLHQLEESIYAAGITKITVIINNSIIYLKLFVMLSRSPDDSSYIKRLRKNFKFPDPPISALLLPKCSSQRDIFCSRFVFHHIENNPKKLHNNRSQVDKRNFRTVYLTTLDSPQHQHFKRKPLQYY
jgi:hypothetical protein